MSGRLPPKLASNRDQSVFINAPYGPEYQDLFLGYVVGAVGMGLIPHAGVESFGEPTARLHKIHNVLEACRYSFHDLSCVFQDSGNPLPRFNMPLELGMAIAEEGSGRGRKKHTWIAFDSDPYRYSKIVSDVLGLDRVLNHQGTPEGIFRELLSNLRVSSQVRGNMSDYVNALNFAQMSTLFGMVKAAVPAILSEVGRSDIFAPESFKQVAAAALQFRAELIVSRS